MEKMAAGLLAECSALLVWKLLCHSWLLMLPRGLFYMASCCLNQLYAQLALPSSHEIGHLRLVPTCTDLEDVWAWKLLSSNPRDLAGLALFLAGCNCTQNIATNPLSFPTCLFLRQVGSHLNCLFVLNREATVHKVSPV